MRLPRLVLAPFLVVGGCLPDPQANLPEPPQVRLEPVAEDGVERVMRFHVRTESEPLDPAEAWLLAGELSDAQHTRLARGEVAESLLARRLPTSAWLDTAVAETVVEPAKPLVPGAIYTMAAPGFGRLGQFRVRSDSGFALMQRVWPLEDVAGSASAFFCGVDAHELSGELELAPAGLRGSLDGRVGSLASAESCVRVRFDASSLAGTEQLFPPLELGVLWDPRPMPFEAAYTAAPTTCAEGESALGAGCVRPLDDRVLVTNGGEPTLYVIEREGERELHPLRADEQLELRGFSADMSITLKGIYIDRFGAETAFDVAVHTLPSQPHLVLNEVLANPLAPEPAGEWIELFNDGAVGVDLLGLRLLDSGGSIELPSAFVEAGGYALLVRNDFVESSLDVPVAPDTQLVRVPALGKSGLSNSGEALTLADAAGNVLSRFPARPSAHAGVSVARRSGASLDADATSFGPHAAPGASPGSANVLAE